MTALTETLPRADGATFRMRLDISRCLGCRACEVACVTVNDLTPAFSRTWVPFLEADPDLPETPAVFAPYLCAHCADPPCVPACPTGASYVAEDGRVLVDRDLCIGCGLCVDACPYDARFVNPITSTLDKCTLCEGRVAEGLAPACFEVCPAEARIFEEVRTVDGERVVIRVGDWDRLDDGHAVTQLVSAEATSSPRLFFSGRPEHLELLHALRPPTAEASVAGAVWRKGAGLAVKLLGYASLAAMGTMVGVRALGSRRERVARTEQAESETQSNEDSNE